MLLNSKTVPQLCAMLNESKCIGFFHCGFFYNVIQTKNIVSTYLSDQKYDYTVLFLKN